MLGLLPIKRVLILLSAILLVASSAFAQDGFISARNFAETQGISYQWFPIQKMLVMRKGLKSVKLTVNETTASVDDKMVNLPAAPVIRDGQIMVPAAAIVRLFQGDLELQSPTSENLNTAPPVINSSAGTSEHSDSTDSTSFTLAYGDDNTGSACTGRSGAGCAASLRP